MRVFHCNKKKLQCECSQKFRYFVSFISAKWMCFWCASISSFWRHFEKLDLISTLNSGETIDLLIFPRAGRYIIAVAGQKKIIGFVFNDKIKRYTFVYANLLRFTQRMKYTSLLCVSFVNVFFVFFFLNWIIGSSVITFKMFCLGLLRLK